MSILSELLGMTETSSTQSANHPCSNCPSNCDIYPNACSVCQPYKEKMVDALYNVEHMDEIVARYEVVADAAPSGGTVECPHCGANTTNVEICEYCGSKLQEASNKIKVSSASEIPNPILICQDIIFDRSAAVSKFSSNNSAVGIFDALQDIMNGGLLQSLMSDISGITDDDSTIGHKMSEAEIRDMARQYGVSVSAYLNGLDCGKYLTSSAKEKCDNARSNPSGYGSYNTAGAVAAAQLLNAALGGSTASSNVSRTSTNASRTGSSNSRNDYYGRQPGMNQQGHPAPPNHQAPPNRPGMGAHASQSSRQGFSSQSHASSSKMGGGLSDSVRNARTQGSGLSNAKTQSGHSPIGGVNKGFSSKNAPSNGKKKK